MYHTTGELFLGHMVILSNPLSQTGWVFGTTFELYKQLFRQLKDDKDDP